MSVADMPKACPYHLTVVLQHPLIYYTHRSNKTFHRNFLITIKNFKKIDKHAYNSEKKNYICIVKQFSLTN